MKWKTTYARHSTKSQLRVGAGRKSAFTLVEMLLVITILGILAAIVLPKVVGTGDRARIQAAKTQINAFKTALDMFEVDNGHYPRGKTGLRDLVVQPKDANNWHQYMDAIPPDPWGNAYVYEYPGRHNPNGFDIMSKGPPGGPEIANWETTTR